MPHTRLPINIDELIKGRTIEAERFFNYPYEALEEALVNAVYHRSYEIREPIEVRILPDGVTIASYPGPDRSVNLDDLRTGHGVTRRYRNRRIGEFLKELNLTEGRGTGIPKILRAIQKNGSPLPVFETDDDRTYFVARFPIHPKAIHRITKEERAEPEEPGTKLAPSWHQVGTKLGLEPGEIMKVLNLCKSAPKLTDLMEAFSWSDRTKFRNKYLNPLIGEGLLEMTIPDKPKSSLQRYRTTEKGREWAKNMM